MERVLVLVSLAVLLVVADGLQCYTCGPTKASTARDADARCLEAGQTTECDEGKYCMTKLRCTSPADPTKMQYVLTKKCVAPKLCQQVGTFALESSYIFTGLSGKPVASRCCMNNLCNPNDAHWLDKKYTGGDPKFCEP